MLWANDDLFAAKENLIAAGPARHSSATFGHKGQVYDGWETRRTRGVGPESHDSAIVRLGVPAIVRGLVVDTSWFTGNHPAQISVQAAFAPGHPSAQQLVGETHWTTLVPRSKVGGDCLNPFEVASDRAWTHLRLCIYPDGGVARLRVHGEGLLDPGFADLPLDLAALQSGARVLACSDMFYGSPNNLLLPGVARTIGEGWETARRRDSGNDWVHLQLAGSGLVTTAELDTSCFIGNAPGAARLSGRDGSDPRGEWFELLALTELQPDTRHRFRLGDPRSVTEARLDIYPDGGMARLRLYGTLTAAGQRRAREKWDTGGRS